jgi:hypothetical protein
LDCREVPVGRAYLYIRKGTYQRQVCPIFLQLWSVALAGIFTSTVIKFLEITNFLVRINQSERQDIQMVIFLDLKDFVCYRVEIDSRDSFGMNIENDVHLRELIGGTQV